jgi:hypothetical protein
MPKRRVGQLDFVDGLVAQRRQSRPSALTEIAGLVDWSPFEKLLSALPVSARGEAVLSGARHVQGAALAALAWPV